VRIPLMMALSLAIALILNRAVRAIGFYRAAFYMPAIVPMVAASLLWAWLFNPAQGVINNSLTWLFDTAPLEWIERLLSTGAEKFHLVPPLWLSDPAWSKPSLVIMSTWTAGASMIIWLAGLQSINPSLYEAASIDGAGAWRRFRHVTLPMLSPYVLFNSIIGVIATMQIFGEAYIMTAGGPADSTMFYAYYLFKQAFQYFRMGYASALAWILFLIVLALTVLQLWLSKRWVHYEQA
jgi:multiple sugar transport system permease protein